MLAEPPGRRSIFASLPNQALRPSAVVSAAHTLAGGCAISTVRSMRSGNPMTASSYSNLLVAIIWQPFGCVNPVTEFMPGRPPIPYGGKVSCSRRTTNRTTEEIDHDHHDLRGDRDDLRALRARGDGGAVRPRRRVPG